MDYDLTRYKTFRVMPTRIGEVRVPDAEGQGPVVAMTYCSAEEATSWCVEGMNELGEAEFVCECEDQFTAYFLQDLVGNESNQQKHELTMRRLSGMRRDLPKRAIN